MCSVDGCTREIRAKGLCNRHYRRAARSNGDPLGFKEKCIRCGKPTTDNRRAYCSKECKVEGQKANSRRNALAYHYRNRDRENAQHRADVIKKKFGITVERYDEMAKGQGGVCAICQKPCTSGRRLAIDHDHKTGNVRALLCGNCNNGIGKFAEEPELLRRAADYIEQHRTSEPSETAVRQIAERVKELIDREMLRFLA